MGSKNDKKNDNWYYDQYIVANVQKNILLLISVFLCICIFISLILVKYVYENKSVEPYLISIDDRTGQATMVESQSVREFTASEVIKESFVIKYVKLRESYNRSTSQDDENELRVLTAKDAFLTYKDDPKLSASYEVRNIRSGNPEVKTTVKSIIFTTPKSAELKITKQVTDGNGGNVYNKYYRVRVVFDFFTLELDLGERYLNPLGFQVVSYNAFEEKVAEDYNPDLHDADRIENTNINNAGNVAQNQ